jgi:pimeloyl-ACP methyl ester carboxylesterase
MEPAPHHPFRSAEARDQYLALYELRAKQWPVGSETRMVETSWGQTFVRISGPAGAPPLVLLPGIAISSLMWGFNVEAWSAGYRTYAVDHIYDVGRSIYTRSPRGADDLTAWLDELFTALSLGDQINLLGLSFGGWQVSEYALRHPDRLAAAILVAPAGTVLPVRTWWVIRGLLSGTCRPLRRSFMYWMMRDSVRRDEASRLFVEEMMDDAEIASRCFLPKRMIIPRTLGDEELRSLRVRTLYLVGENETICSAEEAVRRVRQVAPQIQAEIIPGAGHDLVLAQTKLLDQKVLAFLAHA